MKKPRKRKSIRISIQLRTTAMILVAAIVPIVIIAVTFFSEFSDMVVADTVRTEQTEAAAMVPIIEDKIEEVEGYMKQISESEYFQDMFYETVDGDLSDYATGSHGADFANLLDSILEEGTVRNIKIYTELPESSGVYSSFADYQLYEEEKVISANYWHGILLESESPYLYAASNYLGVRERETFGDCAYIYRVITNYQETVYTSYIVLYHDSSIYSESLENSERIAGSVSYILTDRNSVVATTDEGLSGLYRVRYEDVQAALLSSNSFVEKEITGRSVYAAYYYIASTKWMMITILPKQPILDLANSAIHRFVTICIFIIVIVVAIALLISGSLSRRIAKVSREMQNAKNGVPDHIKEGYVNDEVSDLVESYNYMVDEINQLLIEQEKSAEELRKAEYNSLQAQINPHFLYNTMDMINWMTLQGRNEEASEVIQALAKFYKLTLSRKKDYSTIEDELNHAMIYIQLMNMRYDNIIEFVTDVPDELTQYRIPKLTFQPILENAILHGLLEKEERGGTIVLTAWEENDTIFILISDDGVGIKPEVLPLILAEKKVDKTKGSNIAVFNIHNRIKLLYGEEYGLSYESEYGNGCEVTIHIPKHLGDDVYIKS